MIRKKETDASILEALEQAILEAVKERITVDPDVADAYMRINPNEWSITIMYVEESCATWPNNDIALLDLMIDRNESDGFEDWMPNVEAIHDLAQSYHEMVEIQLCMN
ncbi:MAG: hypothetical protein NC453_05350 [Muribaculum sp.]|nr:hypothetical protein [Muribaculum sp.]